MSGHANRGGNDWPTIWRPHRKRLDAYAASTNHSGWLHADLTRPIPRRFRMWRGTDGTFDGQMRKVTEGSRKVTEAYFLHRSSRREKALIRGQRILSLLYVG